MPIVPGAILFDLLNGGDKAWGADARLLAPRPPRRPGSPGPEVALGSVRRRPRRDDRQSQGRPRHGELARTSSGCRRRRAGCRQTRSARRQSATARISGRAPYEQGVEFGGPRLSCAAAGRRARLPHQGRRAAQHDPRHCRHRRGPDQGGGQPGRDHGAGTVLHEPCGRPMPRWTATMVFAAATARASAPASPVDQVEIGMLAADCVARAVARGIYEATPLAVSRCAAGVEEQVRVIRPVAARVTLPVPTTTSLP